MTDAKLKNCYLRENRAYKLREAVISGVTVKEALDLKDLKQGGHQDGAI